MERRQPPRPVNPQADRRNSPHPRLHHNLHLSTPVNRRGTSPRPSTSKRHPSTLRLPPSTLRLPPSTLSLPPSTLRLPPSTLSLPPHTRDRRNPNILPPHRRALRQPPTQCHRHGTPSRNPRISRCHPPMRSSTSTPSTASSPILRPPLSRPGIHSGPFLCKRPHTACQPLRSVQ
jgi:hypothetical protein